MNLSIKWLNDFVNTDGIDIKEYCDVMTETGSKVEGYETIASDIDNVFVGRITKITPHENSDHLQICMLDMGDGNEVQIVTGAQNVFEGAIVTVARPVAHLPGNVVIKPGKLRGVQSDGMLCSIGELNLTEHEMPGANNDGILILDEEYFADKIGWDIHKALMMDDSVVEFEITSNRPDCLSVIGLARETAVSFNRPFNVPSPSVKGCGDGDKVENHISVDVKAPELCYRYSAKVVKNVKIAPSPLWLRMRLAASGVRPINNIVDITNYVMLEYGQPMHAFDYKCLDGAHIHVRRAHDGELYKSLDINDEDRPLKSSMLVIADDNKPVALAGVMGGANSEITDDTVTVIFESANFEGVSVRRAAKAMGIRTESSGRFEKGMDPENTMPALMRACELVQLLGAGDVVDGIIDEYPGKRELRTVKFDHERINKFLGISLSREYMTDILEKLSFKVDGDTVTVPSWRNDVECMNDLAEEIVRMYGYNNIETTLPVIRMAEGGRTERQSFEESLHSLLCGMGLWESATFSFIGPKMYDMIRLPENDKKRSCVVISNPLGEDTSVMRTTALPSILEVLSHNQNHKNESASMYELATVYIPTSPTTLPEEKKTLVIGSYGKGDFYVLKGMCERVLELAGISGYKFVTEREDPTFHPGRCAKLLLGDNVIGTLGQIHPETASAFGLSGEIYAAELDMEAIYENRDLYREFHHLPKYPSTSRDFSFVCDEDLEAGKIQDICLEAGGKLTQSAVVYDVYRGEKIGEGKKSITVRVTLRAADRTLTDEEADKAADKMLRALSEKLGITLRDK